MTRPVVFAALADVELAPNPICPDWIIEGAPRASAKRLAQSTDGTASVVAWSCTAGRFNWHYGVDETVHIVSGEVFVTDHRGQVRRLGPGDVAFFPAGTRSVWHVPEQVKKLAVCRHSMPRPFGFMLRAWNSVVNRLTGFSAGGGQLGGDPVSVPAGVPALGRH
jgi:uncharacterized cupin superfamily protein